MTLIELTVVLLILIALAGIAIPYVAGTGAYAQCTATEASMVAIRNAIVGSFEKPGYFEDMGGLPGNLQGLLAQDYCEQDGSLTTQLACTDAGNNWILQENYNPVTKRGWRGPYLSSEINDAFNLNPIQLQIPATEQNARLVSLGPDGFLDTGAADDNASPRGDDRVLFLFMPDSNATLLPACDETL